MSKERLQAFTDAVLAIIMAGAKTVTDKMKDESNGNGD